MIASAETGSRAMQTGEMLPLLARHKIQVLLKGIRPSPDVYRSRRARIELRACTDALAPFGNSSSPPSKPAPTSTSSRSGMA
jgi:hypothetical protein